MPAPAVVGALMESLGGLKGAAEGVQGQFTGLANTLRPFVEAFSPGAILAFDQAMRDLSAVVGSAVLPVFGVLTGAVREFSSILLPALEELRPAVQQAADVFRSLVSGALANFGIVVEPLKMAAELAADLLTALSPLLDHLRAVNGLFLSLVSANLQVLFAVLSAQLEAAAPLFRLLAGLTAPVRALSVVVQGLAAGLRSFLAGFSLAFDADWVDEFADSMRELSLHALVAAAALARLVGADSFVEGMRKALGGARKDASGYGAPKDARVGSDISQFAKELSQLAALASRDGVGDAAKSEEEVWRQQALARLNDLPNATALLGKKIDDMSEAIVKAIKEGTKDGIGDLAANAAAEAARAATDPLGYGLNLLMNRGRGRRP